MRCVSISSHRRSTSYRLLLLWTVKRTVPISALLRSLLIRKVVKQLILWEKKSVTGSGDNLTNYSSVPKYRYGEVEDKDQIVIIAPNDEEGHNLADRRALVAWAVPRIPRTPCSAARS